MKRALGITLLILAAIGAFGVIKNWSKPEPRRQFGRSAAYESGRKAGKAAAPVIVIALGLAGLYLLKNSGPRAAYPPHLSTAPSIPWRKTKPAKILLLSAAAIVALFGCLIILSVSTRLLRRSPAPSAARPPTARPDFGPAGIARTGPYQVDSKVQARWAGTTLPGRITKIHPGGFNVMVQLQDPRFPHPILLSTNQLKPK